MTNKSLKDQAIIYRKRGYSYGMIKERLGTPKSTLSDWLKDTEYSPNKEVIRRIGIARAKSGQLKHEKRIASIKKAKGQAKKDINKLSKRDVFMLGIGLYWGEGAKRSGETVSLMNCDPKIINTTIKWLQNTCSLKSENFKLTVHAYPDNNINKCIRYWSLETGIPKTQFCKSQIDRRTDKKSKKKNMLPYGTLKIVVRSNGNEDFGVYLHRRIIGWIDAVANKTGKRG